MHAFALRYERRLCVNRLVGRRLSQTCKGIIGSSTPLAETELAARVLMITKLPLVSPSRR